MNPATTVALETLRLRPMTITEAKAWMATRHRHNKPPVSGLFAVGVECGDDIRGVAIAGRPVARKLDDGRSVEVTRLCTDGTANACSMLYGAIRRAAKALGYDRCVTYTLASEPGVSLRAAGWVVAGSTPARPTWSSPTRARITEDLFGTPQRPTGAKLRWEASCK